MTLSIGKKALLLIPSFALAGSAFMISNTEAKEGRQNLKALLNTTQQQELFETRKAWELSNTSNRIAIINDARSCIDAAQTPEAFRSCKRNARKSHGALKEQRRRKINAKLNSLGLEAMPSQLRHRHSKGNDNRHRLGPKCNPDQA
ncbi:MAG TPA: hypothetical protein ACN46P_02070 [Prochlorococcus sp.]|nr:hypothetical protein [Prochlorococcaceae cyanobacterium ETNP14_MAG_5]|tara:strand:- start:57 stop:494 length:438 start_codon:yes stop_codon:yes gene_type:complete